LAEYLTDAEIEALLDEPKRLPEGFRERLVAKPQRGHQGAEFDVIGDNGAEFTVILRRSAANPLDFSVILSYQVPTRTRPFASVDTTAKAILTRTRWNRRGSTTFTFTPPPSGTSCPETERTRSLKPAIGLPVWRMQSNVCSRTAGSCSRPGTKLTSFGSEERHVR